MAELDAQVVPPARLKLMIMLTAVSKAEFSTVRDALKVSDSVLSKHLAVLADVNYIRRRKGTHRGRRTTWISLTPRGRKALQAHVAALRQLIGDVGQLTPTQPGLSLRSTGLQGESHSLVADS